MNPYSDFSVPAFDQFLIWLSTTDLRLFLYRFEDWDWLFVFLHVVSASILLGAILLVDLRMIGVMRRLDVRQLAALSVPWAIGGGVVAVLSGLVLLMFDPISHGVHTYFLPKMALILLGLVNALAFHRLTKFDAVDTRKVSSRVAGVLSIALWAGVFLCASLNATERISSTTHAEMVR